MTRLLDRGVPYRRVGAGDAGIVQQDVDPAEVAQRCIAGGLDAGEIADVAGVGLDGRAELGGCLAGALDVEVPDRDLGAGCDEALRSCAADALRTPGNDGDAVLEIDGIGHGLVLPVCRWRAPLRRGPR
jgi:hypothetical protein